MIILKDNTTKLEGNSKDFLDKNKEMAEIIQKLKVEFAKFSDQHEALVTLSGPVNKVKFDINADKEESALYIENLIEKFASY